MRIPAALAPVVDLIFPPRCPLCGEGISGHDGLCAVCWQTLAVPGEPACHSCQRPFADSTAEGSVCAVCLAKPPQHDGIAAATLYNESSRRLVLTFKHGHRIALAPMLARLVMARLRGVDATWLVVPVPLHRWRLWSRGYNQSALLGGEIARVLGADMAVDALVRTRATPPLRGLGAKARARQLRGAIALADKWQGRLAGRDILLVDDVLTSGATTGACIRVLKRAGAARVRIACFARVLDEALDVA